MSEGEPTKKEVRALRKEKIRVVFEQKKTTIKKTGGVLILIVLAIFAIQIITKEIKHSAKNQTAVLANIITHKDWTRGVENPNIDIIIYANFDCEECVQASELVAQAATEFQSRTKITYRHFFDKEKSTRAEKLAKFAETAGLQNKFWEAHDLLFGSQKEIQTIGDVNAIVALYAQKLNLNIDQIKNDMYAYEITSKIKRDLENAAIAGVKNAPTIFINNIKIENPKTYDDLKSVIEKSLGEKVQ